MPFSTDPLPTLSAQQLIAFEEDIAAEFNAAKIRAPVHLSFGNEEALIEIFRRVRPQDWVLGSWRSHYQCLLTGALPIAVGIGMAMKREGADSVVHCFMGEMTSETGAAHECIKYSRQWDLPIHWIIEDNRKSVCTDTRAVWNSQVLTYENSDDPRITYYRYESKYPHAGAGVRVQF